jgi:hypothetical protein
MSMTKETPEFKDVFGNVNPDEKKAAGTPPLIDEIDQIIDFFEEKMQIDGLPKGRYGVEIDAPDVEPYIGDRKEARDFILARFHELAHRLFKEIKEPPAIEDIQDMDENREPSMDMNDLD